MPRRNDIRKILVTIALIMAMATAARAQVTMHSPYHLPRLHGVFVDAKGNPIPGAAVTVGRDDKVLHSTTTDDAGEFEIKHIAGSYWLHINMKGYSTVSREVIIGEGVTYLRGGTLYMIAGPAACTDDCTSVFTSKSQFEHAIRRNITEHYD